MIVNKKTIIKLERILTIYKDYIFTPIESISMEFCTTFKHYRQCPTNNKLWNSSYKNLIWGKAWQSMWMRGNFKVPDDFNGDKLYIQADTGAVEVLFIVDNNYKGIFNIESEEGVRGLHHTRLFLNNPIPGNSHNITLECYAGHPCVGTMPDDIREDRAENPDTYKRVFKHVTICTKSQKIMDFITELRILLQIATKAGTNSFRGASIYKNLEYIYKIVPMQPKDYTISEINNIIDKAREIIKPELDKKNGDSAPFTGIIGHSHMDTAWLWTIDETIRKCARTFSNTLNMMDEYPGYMFLQSAPLHLEMMEREYPSIFNGIKERIAEGRWEPNGGSWIEPDCNIPSGESLVRHFLYGQKYLKEKFNYRADTFWQPDVFGYSASIPQILKQCGIKNFLTTKLSWNEETRFPYDTFYWSGIDGTSVFTHFNTTHCWPDPESLITQTANIQHKDIQHGHYCAFGYGDGGGGPQFEMLETAEYMKDIEGVPKTEYLSVSKFMDKLEISSDNFPKWIGELYLELHRGTLTSHHQIKKNNRTQENLLREVEFIYSYKKIMNEDIKYPIKELERLWKVLLINQFHDILPGTSISEVNVKSKKDMSECIHNTTKLIKDLYINDTHKECYIYQIWNSRSWIRNNCLELSNISEDLSPIDSSVEWQKISTINGDKKLLVKGVTVPGLGSTNIILEKNSDKKSSKTSFITFNNNILTTPLYKLIFNETGAIISYVNIKKDRELISENGLFNNFLMGEDIPALWDNWDIDIDQENKMKPIHAENPWKILEAGPLQVRLENRYTLSANSYLDQHMILYRDSMKIDFETVVHWNEKHKLLKSEFALNIDVNQAKYEIQYGHLNRNTHKNLPQDKVQFEVCNHQWTDMSESNNGISLLNDCKYGISNSGSILRLSLLKSGTHPDPSGDQGVHTFTYSILPHNGSFSTVNVIRPARELNSPLTVIPIHGEHNPADSLIKINKDNILLDYVKLSEDGTGFIFRLYEAEKNRTNTILEFSKQPKQIFLCNMLEEVEMQITSKGYCIDLSFHGFEIITLKVIW